MRVNVVFNRVNFEWLVTVKSTSKFVFKIYTKKISCKDMEIKNKILQDWNNKKNM